MRNGHNDCDRRSAGGVSVALKLGGPMLILSMLVGVVIAIFQAVTQIHEQTISFMLKLIVVILVLLIGGRGC